MTHHPPNDRMPRRLLLPWHWPAWLGFGLLRLLTWLPWPLAMASGRGLGALLYRLPLKTRDYARTNIRLCFPDLDAAARRRLLRAHYTSLGMSLVETAMAWWAPARKLRDRYRIEGLEHLDAALARGRGALLLSAHFTTLELGGRLLSLERPFAVMYRDQKNPVADRIMRRARQRHFRRAIHRNDVRQMLRALKENTPVWYAPDQNYSGRNFVFAPFCGIPAATNTATGRISRAAGAPVLPFFQRRTASGDYQLTILPPLADFPSGDDAADAAAVNQAIQHMIRQAPEQYLWEHRRFKTRPAGEAGLYTGNGILS